MTSSASHLVSLRAKGFPWNVLSGSLEYDGLGGLQLATEVTKARLRQFQSMITSSAAADCSVAMAMVSLAQRWCGSSKPVNMLSTDELHLLEPLDATAPQAAHMFHELRRLGYKVAVGWVVRPQAAGDETIYDAYMREAGITGRTEEEIARLQRWRRENDVMWVSELFRADGITLRDRFMKNLAARARRCESDAIRLCNIAFGRGRGPANQSSRPRVGLPTTAAWDVIGVGSYVWHDGALGLSLIHI